MQRETIQQAIKKPEKISLSLKNKFDKPLLMLDYGDRAIAAVDKLASNLENYLSNFSSSLFLDLKEQDYPRIFIKLKGLMRGNLEISPKQIENLKEFISYFSGEEKLYLAFRKVWTSDGEPFTDNIIDSIFILEEPFVLEIPQEKIFSA